MGDRDVLLGAVGADAPRGLRREAEQRLDRRAGLRARPELEELPEIQATLPADGRTPGDVVPVRLRAGVTAVGTLRLEAMPRAGKERWKVELDVREQG